MKLIKWVLPIIVGTFPAYCMENSSKGILNDPFFTDNSTVVHLKETREDSGKVMFSIKGKNASKSENRLISFEAVTKITGYKEDDSAKTYQEIVEASVKCGELTLKDTLTLSTLKPYPSIEQFVYVVELSAPVLAADLPLGKVAQRIKETIYTKPSTKAEIKTKGSPKGRYITRGIQGDTVVSTIDDFFALNIERLPIHLTTLVTNETLTLDSDPVIYDLMRKTITSPLPSYYEVCTRHNYQHKHQFTWHDLQVYSGSQTVTSIVQVLPDSREVNVRDTITKKTLTATNMLATLRKDHDSLWRGNDFCFNANHKAIPLGTTQEALNAGWTIQ